MTSPTPKMIRSMSFRNRWASSIPATTLDSAPNNNNNHVVVPKSTSFCLTYQRSPFPMPKTSVKIPASTTLTRGKANDLHEEGTTEQGRGNSGGDSYG